MPTLGDVLGAAKRSAVGIERWLKAVDPTLAQAVSQTAEAAGVSVAGYARIAVADFSRWASEEDWGRLTRSMRDSDDPGAACLAFMVHWNLEEGSKDVENKGAESKDEESKDAMLL